MLLVIEIVLLVAGIAALITGRIALGSEREASGTVARIAGAVFLLPLPMALAAGILIGVLSGLKGRNGWDQEAHVWATVAEWTIVIGCGGLGLGIAFAGSQEADSGYRRRRRDADDLAPRRASAAVTDTVEWIDDEGDAAPRRRRPTDVRRGLPVGLIAGLLIGAVCLIAVVAGVAFWAFAWSAVGGPGAAPAAVPAAIEPFVIHPPGRQPNAPTPPELEADAVTRRLPGKVGELAVGGDGGRYLVLHLPDVGQLAVFDADQGEIAHTVPAGKRLLVAACRDRAFTIDPVAKKLHRYSLPTMALEASADLGMRTTPVAAAIGEGCINGGTLCVVGVALGLPGETAFFDVERMARTRTPGLDVFNTFRVTPQARVFASYLGEYFACQGQPGGAVEVCGPPFNAVSRGDVNGADVTGLGPADGRGPLHTTKGLVDAQVRDKEEHGAVCVPGRGPYGYVVSVLPEPAGDRSEVVIARKVRDRADQSIGGVAGLRGQSDLGRRVFYVPDAGLLIALSPERDSLVLRLASPLP